MLELLVVIAVIVLIFAVVRPSSTTVDDAKLDLAAQEIANAIRFAREEAIRLNSDVNAWTGVVAVDIGDAALAFNGAGVGAGASANGVGVYDFSGHVRGAYLVQPIDKKSYNTDISRATASEGVRITRVAIQNASASVPAGTRLGFDSEGLARQFYNQGGTWVAPQVTSGVIEVSFGARLRTVALDANGRVTVY